MTAAAPSGVVTFLFTDIEGSTGRWETDADLRLSPPQTARPCMPFVRLKSCELTLSELGSRSKSLALRLESLLVRSDTASITSTRVNSWVASLSRSG
jgi:hypothetical protein